MSEMPSDLSAMLEAVEKYMGEQFTEMLVDALAANESDTYWGAVRLERKMHRAYTGCNR